MSDSNAFELSRGMEVLPTWPVTRTYMNYHSTAIPIEVIILNVNIINAVHWQAEPPNNQSSDSEKARATDAMINGKAMQD